MPTFSLPGFNDYLGQEELVDEIAKMRKELDWLLTNLDSVNIFELTANKISAGTIDVDKGIYVLSETGGVTIDTDGLEIRNGKFKMYTDDALTLLVDGDTFYGDNLLITGNAFIGEDIYMNADYLSYQPRHIYFDKNIPEAYYIVLDTGFAGGPRCSFIDFEEVYINSPLTVGGDIYARGGTVATETYVNNAIAAHVADYHSVP